MPDIRTSDAPSNPARVLTDAINLADAMRIKVTTGPDLGVVLTSRNPPHWEPEPRAAGVSPLGAVLLIRQPAILDLEQAIGNALGMGLPFCAGFEEGCAGARPSEKWTTSNSAALYLEGWELGKTFQTAIITTVCSAHRIRYVRADGCPRCAGVPIPHTAETTDTLPAELRSSPPLKLIGRLLASLTLAEALEAVIETVPGRSCSTDTKADVVEDLWDLADEYRRQGL